MAFPHVAPGTVVVSHANDPWKRPHSGFPPAKPQKEIGYKANIITRLALCLAFEVSCLQAPGGQ
eukprot:1110136-Lingulodinium_polyedra.AAC.1